jgi:hypothetical protein
VAVVDLLEKHLCQSPENIILKKWVEDLNAGAKALGVVCTSRLIPPITLINTRQTVHDLLLTGEDLDKSSTESLVHGMDDLDVDVDMYLDPVPAGARPKRCRKRDVTMIVDSDDDNSTPEILDQRPTHLINANVRRRPMAVLQLSSPVRANFRR